MSLGEQALQIAAHSSQREAASVLRGSTQHPPKNQEAAELHGPA